MWKGWQTPRRAGREQHAHPTGRGITDVGVLADFDWAFIWTAAAAAPHFAGRFVRASGRGFGPAGCSAAGETALALKSGVDRSSGHEIMHHLAWLSLVQVLFETTLATNSNSKVNGIR